LHARIRTAIARASLRRRRIDRRRPRRAGTLIVSVLYAGLVARGRTGYPRWMAALNPTLLALTTFALYRSVPAVGKFVAPVAMNFAHVVLFGASSWLLCRAARPRGVVACDRCGDASARLARSQF
jgi:hypothetical protein